MSLVQYQPGTALGGESGTATLTSEGRTCQTQ